jgi:uncharacterized protein YbaR (Trm112 family)
MIDKELLDILVCPICRKGLNDEDEALVCVACGRRYAVRDGIPDMLPEHAELPGEKGSA